MKKAFALSLFLLVVTYSVAQHHAIRVVKSGKGSPVIFLPGFTTPGSVWNETVQHLKGRYEVHLVSYAGFNGIPPIEMPWYDGIKKELLQYIGDQHFKSVLIIGHSMGGTLAADIASEMPGVTMKLILVDALPCMRELMMPNVPASQITYDNPYNQRMMQLSDEAFIQNAKMMGQYMTMNTEKIDTLVKWSVQADRKTYVYGYTDLLKVDVRDALEKVTAKTLIIGASFPDKNLATTNFEKQYAKLKDKSIAIADNSKHFVMFDQPEWFYDQVNTFLAK